MILDELNAALVAADERDKAHLAFRDLQNQKIQALKAEIENLTTQLTNADEDVRKQVLVEVGPVLDKAVSDMITLGVVAVPVVKGVIG